MKKVLVLMMALVMTLTLTACGGEAPAPTQGSSAGTEATTAGSGGAPSEPNFASMTFGDITMSVPDVFGAVEEQGDYYVSSGPNASITVTKATEVDIAASEWNEDLAKEAVAMYSSTYTNIELSAFQGDVDMNGSPAVYYGFNGVNADGIDRLVQIVRLYNADQTMMYLISMTQSVDDAFLTAEVGGEIINSITLNQ